MEISVCLLLLTSAHPNNGSKVDRRKKELNLIEELKHDVKEIKDGLNDIREHCQKTVMLSRFWLLRGGGGVGGIFFSDIVEDMFL